MSDRPTVFISYSRRHDIWRRKIRSVLEQCADVLDDHGIIGGTDWWEAIFDMISRSDAMIYLVSAEANASRICRAECEFARDLGIDIIPVSVDAGQVEPPPFVGRLQSIPYVPRDDVLTAALVVRVSGIARRERSDTDDRPASPRSPLYLDDRLEELFTAGIGSESEIVDALGTRVDELGLDEKTRAFVDRLKRMNVRRSTESKIKTWSGMYRAGQGRGREALQGLVDIAREEPVTPVIGWGATEHLLGDRTELAMALARQIPYAMSPRDAEEPHLVAQYLDTVSGRPLLARQWRSWLWEQMGSPPQDGESHPWAALSAAVVGLTDTRSQGFNDALAKIKCPLYITTLPTSALEDALKRAERDPVSLVFDWRRHVPGGGLSAGGTRAGRPDEGDLTSFDSVEKPVVYHLHGTFDRPDLLVLTEDDHLDFLMAASSDAMPVDVRGAATRSHMLLVGFDLLHWETRVALRAIAYNEGAYASQSYRHLAIHDDVRGRVADEAHAQIFVEKYLSSLPSRFGTYWGYPSDVEAEFLGPAGGA